MKEDRVKLKVNGKEVPLKPWVEGFIANSIEGMVKSLKGCESPEKIEILVVPNREN